MLSLIQAVEGVLARLFYGKSKRLSEGLSLRAKERYAGMPLRMAAVRGGPEFE